MKKQEGKNLPGQVRDAIIHTLATAAEPMSLKRIEEDVEALLGPTPTSSIRSYLQLNTPALFIREDRGVYSMRQGNDPQFQAHLTFETKHPEGFVCGRSKLYNADCMDWLSQERDHSFHAAVTDPPYGLHEYSFEQQAKLREGKGGVWRIPPSFDGHKRSPLPRFTVLKEKQLEELRVFFLRWGTLLKAKLVPGAHVIVASNPLLSYIVSWALSESGLERRGELIRMVMTMRGGDRPKLADKEFPEVSVMPRSMWEPWLIYRSPLEGRVQDNLRKWKTGGFRRPTVNAPFGDVIRSSPTQPAERRIAPHPSLKPQAFLRQIVRAVLPMGEGIVLDPFAGSGSTLAAAEAIGYESIGIEKDPEYFRLARTAIPRLAKLTVHREER